MERIGSQKMASGVIYIHSAIGALCSHVEWAIGRVLGEPVKLNWLAQPALDGTVRAEFYWQGSAGTGAALASELRGWDHLRYEITQDAVSGVDGGRWMHTPALGVFYASTDALGNLVITEDRIRAAMQSAGSNMIEMHRELRLMLGQAWDDELEIFRHASEDNPVVWLHQVV